MPAVYLTDANNTTLAIDAILTESRTYMASVSSKPLEDGTSLSDAKILKNPSYTLEAVITNTPTVFAQQEDVTVTPTFSFLENTLSAGQFFNFDTMGSEKIKVAPVELSSSPVLDAHTFLKNLYTDSKPFSLQIAGYDDIHNAMVTSLKIDFHPDDGDCLHFTLTFVQIKIVSSQTTKVPKNASQSKMSPKKSQGTIQPKKEDQNTADKMLGKGSWLYNLMGK